MLLSTNSNNKTLATDHIILINWIVVRQMELNNLSNMITADEKKAAHREHM